MAEVKGSVSVLLLPAECRRAICAKAIATEREVALLRAVGWTRGKWQDLESHDPGHRVL